jgi:glycosyltransferase involved in cell wall biosynthesis
MSCKSRTPAPEHRRKLALVLWKGAVGGAEAFSVTLAQRLRGLGADIEVVFIAEPQPLASRLSSARVPCWSLGFKRGRDVAWHPRRYASEIARIGPDGALLVERGFMGAALRAGGYGGVIVTVEHGPLLFEQQDLTRPQRLVRQISRVGGAQTVDAEVAVSDFMLKRMRQHSHARLTRRIYNGVDPDRYRPATESPSDCSHGLVVGFAGRLIPGKGADHLIRAVAQANEQIPIKLLIAGSGPEHPRLAAMAQEVGLASKIDFLGLIEDLPAFWQRCHVAAVPSDTFVESFSMVTVEAMACAKPIVATAVGAIPELIMNGVTGTLIPPRDVKALARALVTYAERPGLQRTHGAAARAQVIERFHIEDCARAYLDLFDELSIASAAPTNNSG